MKRAGIAFVVLATVIFGNGQDVVRIGSSTPTTMSTAAGQVDQMIMNKATGKKALTRAGIVMIPSLPKSQSCRSYLHPVLDRADGCIALTNTKLGDVRTLVQDGTPVTILPS
ncbi:MAG: hypothetical protein AAGM84_14595 [Pseudomonadota bacterium]